MTDNQLPVSPQSLLRWFIVGWLPLFVALVISTWPVWRGANSFPQVPLLAWSLVWPRWVDSVMLVLFLVGITVAFATRLLDRRLIERWSSACCIVALGILFAMNQQRLQPWAYAGWLMLIVLCTCRDEIALMLLRGLVISIYTYSALSKLDFAFLHTTGQQFLVTLSGFVGVTVELWNQQVRLIAAAMFPLVELAVAICLANPRMRRAGVVVGILMHGLLIMMFSSVGMRQTAGVMVWNVSSIWILGALFWFSPRVDSKPERTTKQLAVGTADWLGVIILLAAMILPALESIDSWDHWPSWGLYAPRNSGASVFIAEAKKASLPDSVQACLAPARFNDPEFDRPVFYLNLAKLSLDQLKVPVYPQDRFQLGVAIGLARRYDLQNDLFVTLQSRSDRMTGRRTIRQLEDYAALLDAADEFQLNALPRVD